MFVLLCTIVVVIVVISLLFHCIFNLIHLFGYASRKCVIKSVFSVQCFFISLANCCSTLFPTTVIIYTICHIASHMSTDRLKLEKSS